jgi:hypothetical protein
MIANYYFLATDASGGTAACFLDNAQAKRVVEDLEIAEIIEEERCSANNSIIIRRYDNISKAA